MEPDIKTPPPTTLWVDRRKIRKTLSPTSFNEVTIYQAHSAESPGFHPYIGKNYHDKIVEQLELEIEKLKGITRGETDS